VCVSRSGHHGAGNLQYGVCRTRVCEAPPSPICDYLFPDETMSDSAERFAELLGFKVDDEHIWMHKVKR